MLRDRGRHRGTGARACRSASLYSQAPTRLGQAIRAFRDRTQRLADFARRGAAAIGDDVGGHGRAQLAVALVDILNGALALIAAGQIEIDVGPFAALFGKEALEEQIHADRIDGGDAERIADGAVGGRAASLHQNVVLAAEAHDVPDDQEIAGQVELFDQRQFALDLLARAFVVRRRSAQSMPSSRALAQKLHLRFAVRHGIVRKFVAQIVQE